MAVKKNHVTPSELLIEVMEEFGKSEPLQCVIVFVSEDGSMNWHSNTDSISHSIGMLEMAKQFIIGDLIKNSKDV